MSIIAITRHGKYLREGNDGHLTNEGALGIYKVARSLKRDFNKLSVNPRRIFCSPLIRSKETAEIFQKVFGVEKVTEDPRIADPRMDLDIHFAMVKSPICNPKNFSTGQVYALLRQPEGFETYNEVAVRFRSFMDDLVNDLGNDDGIVVITHAPTPDHLLLEYFNSGLCKGDDLQYEEFLKIYRAGENFEIEFRGKRVRVKNRELLFNRRYYLSEKEKGGCK